MRPTPRSTTRGFTLIELMIVVAIVAILAAVALPSYRDYMLRGYLTDGTTLLSTMQTSMERYYQDNRTYVSVGTGTSQVYPPCDGTNVAASLRTQGNFTASCTSGPTATSYTLQAVGTGPVAGVKYQLALDATNGFTKSTPVPPTGWPTPSPNTCWVTKRGQAC